MKKKQLIEELLNQGYYQNQYKNFEKNFNNLNISVIIHSNFFGKIKMIGILYKFKQELKEELHDEVWEKSIQIVSNSNPIFCMGALGFDFIEAVILSEKEIKNINANIISESCEQFTSLIKNLLEEYNL